jgi:hypothetical protein
MSAYNPEMLEIMRHALDQAWALLPDDDKNKFTKIDMADRILRRAATGERDLARLRAAALTGTSVKEADASRM